MVASNVSTTRKREKTRIALIATMPQSTRFVTYSLHTYKYSLHIYEVVAR